jgi:branched-chain amino acid transport system ATP-binding protein
VNALHVDRGCEQVLRGLSLSVRRGEAVVLTGRNGSGKSTALLAIAGRLPVTAGSIYWDEGTDGGGVRRPPRCGLLLQSGRVFRSMTVKENLDIAGMALPRGVAAGRIESLAHELPQLATLLSQRASVLSGGERQIVALAMTLLNEPEVLLLDEPFAGVDEANARDIAALLSGVKRRQATAMLIVEHRQSCVEAISDSTIMLDCGRAVPGQPPAENTQRGDGVPVK